MLFKHSWNDGAENQKGPSRGLFINSGGEGGIRTHERLLTFAGFQDQCIQPLCHLSGFATAHCAGTGQMIQAFRENACRFTEPAAGLAV